MKFIKVVALMSVCLGLFGCASSEKGSYEQITPDDAKFIMDLQECIILDVRTEEEFLEKHIKGAINIDYEQIKDVAPITIPDKDALILVYCRSGRRSKIAAEALVKLGYTNVKEFGGIMDWHYETE